MIINKNSDFFYDVIVVGGGHAGIEASYASSRMGARTLLITQKLDLIGELACNPSIGGIGKSHLVKEIDAMGGAMGMIADFSGINFKRLNISKGPAVRSTRIQVDRNFYKLFLNNLIKKTFNLKLIQQTVIDLIIKKNIVIGVKTLDNISFYSKSVVLTLGTFLNGKIFVGNISYNGGRAGEKSSILLANKLKDMSFIVNRLKTGTPPRIDTRSIFFDKLEKQDSDIPMPTFSHWTNTKRKLTQRSCYITHTNKITHDIILQNIKKSSIYDGGVNVVGPRYCPSIEDKLIRFKNKDSHQIFLEPEGLNNYEIYPNGLSTSLPIEIQIKFLKTIYGLEKSRITRVGYSVEYDYFDSRCLNLTLSTKNIKGLFFAGQINGTTGYEEAAAQGLVAGINASCFSLEKPQWIPSRTDSYIGVLVDDLVTKGISEPYRMFTSKAEYRLYLREDNADIRLSHKARELGLLNNRQWNIYLNKKKMLNDAYYELSKKIININSLEFINLNKKINLDIKKKITILDLLKQKDITYTMLKSTFSINISNSILELLEIKIKYSGYVNSQKEELKKIYKYRNISLPKNIIYEEIPSISSEAVEKLNLIQPLTIEQASRIPGITLSTLLILLIYIKNK